MTLLQQLLGLAEQVDDETATLKGRIAEMSNEIDDLTQANEENQSRLNELTTTSLQKEKELKELRREMKTARKDGKAKVAALEQKNAENAKACDAKLQQATETAEELQSNLNSATLRNQRLEKSNKKQVVALENKIRSYELELIQADATVQDTRTRHKASVQQLKASHASEVTRLKSEMETMTQTAQAAATERDQARETLQQRDKELQAKVVRLKSEMETMTQTAQAAATERDQARETLQQRDKELQELQRRVTEVQQKVSGLQAEVQKSNRQIRECKDSKKATNTELKYQKELNTTVHNALKALQKSLKRKEHDHEILKGKLSENERLAESRVSQIASMQSEIEKVVERRQAAVRERDRAREDRTRKDKELIELHQKFSSFQSEWQKKESSSRHREQLATCRAKLEQKEREHDLMRQCLFRNSTNHRVLKERFDKQIETIRNLQTQIDAYVAKENESHALGDQRSNYLAGIKKLEPQMDRLFEVVTKEKDGLISSQSLEMNTQETEGMSQETAIVAIKETIRHLKRDLEANARHHQIHLKRLEEQDERIEDLTDALKKSNVCDGGAASLIEELQKENRLLEDKNNELVTELVVKENQVRDLESSEAGEQDDGCDTGTTKDQLAAIPDKPQDAKESDNSSNVENLSKEIERLHQMVREQRHEIERLVQRDSTLWAQHNYACIERNGYRHTTRVSISPLHQRGLINHYHPGLYTGTPQHGRQLQGHLGGSPTRRNMQRLDPSPNKLHPGNGFTPPRTHFQSPNALPSSSVTKRTTCDSNDARNKKAKMTHCT